MMLGQHATWGQKADDGATGKLEDYGQARKKVICGTIYHHNSINSFTARHAAKVHILNSKGRNKIKWKRWNFH